MATFLNFLADFGTPKFFTGLIIAVVCVSMFFCIVGLLLARYPL